MSVEKLSKVVKILEKEGSVSPNKIAKEAGSDRRTIQKILDVATDLGMAKCEILKVGERKFSACSLTPKYQEILKSKAEG